MCASRQHQQQAKDCYGVVFDRIGFDVLAHLTLATVGCPAVATVLALLVGNNMNRSIM
jgi:hypothetical protein